jgi:hypothetical protein
LYFGQAGVVDPGSALILVGGIRIREGYKIAKSEEISSAGFSLLRAVGFFLAWTSFLET